MREREEVQEVPWGKLVLGGVQGLSRWTAEERVLQEMEEQAEVGAMVVQVERAAGAVRRQTDGARRRRGDRKAHGECATELCI